MIGELNIRIAIKTRGKTSNSLGEIEYDYNTTYATVWAKVEYLGGNEGESSKVQTIQESVKFTIRSDMNLDLSALNTKYLITYRYDDYDIKSVEHTPDNKFIVIKAQTMLPELSV